MATKYQTSFILQALTVVFACTILAGCQSFDLGASLTPESAALESAAPASRADVIGQYRVQLIPGHGKPTVESIDIVGPVTVQDALEVSGAVRKFRTMKITLRRVVKETGRLLKLPVDYDFRTKTVVDSQNYGLLPGDTLTVSPKESKALQKAFGALSGGLI